MDPVVAANESFNIFKYITSEGGISLALMCVVYAVTCFGFYKLYINGCKIRSQEILALVQRNKEISENTVKAFDQNMEILKDTIQSRERTAVSLTEMANAIREIPEKIEHFIIRHNARG